MLPLELADDSLQTASPDHLWWWSTILWPRYQPICSKHREFCLSSFRAYIYGVIPIRAGGRNFKSRSNFAQEDWLASPNKCLRMMSWGDTDTWSPRIHIRIEHADKSHPKQECGEIKGADANANAKCILPGPRGIWNVNDRRSSNRTLLLVPISLLETRYQSGHLLTLSDWGPHLFMAKPLIIF